MLFQKFPSAENKVGRVSNGYPEYPIANLHVTETYPPPPSSPLFSRMNFSSRQGLPSPHFGILSSRNRARSRFPIPLRANKTRTGGYCFSYHTIVLLPSHGFIYYWKKWWGMWSRIGRGSTGSIGIDGKKLDRVSIFSFAKGNG